MDEAIQQLKLAMYKYNIAYNGLSVEEVTRKEYELLRSFNSNNHRIITSLISIVR